MLSALARACIYSQPVAQGCAEGFHGTLLHTFSVHTLCPCPYPAQAETRALELYLSAELCVARYQRANTVLCQ